MMKKDRYEELTTCVDPYFELTHGSVHLWVGGHMADIPISPDDPVFYLHHAFVDYLWEHWRQTKQTEGDRESDYPGAQNSCSFHHLGNRTMLPFPMENREGLANHYTVLFYHYQPRPLCSTNHSDCGSPHLFCQLPEERCLSKVRLGGSCDGFQDEICARGQCIKGVCTLLSKSDCGSPHLFCQLPEERCLSKVRLGGSCDGFQDEICARGQCIKGVCTLLSKSDCGSPHLFCQLPEERCLSKVRLGGSCDGFQDEICARGQCIKGVCTLLSKSDCGSPHLFCQLPEERCLSKVRLGGSCDGFQDEICARGQCIKGVCTLLSKSDCGSPHLFCQLPEERCLSKVRLGGSCDGFQDEICARGQCIKGVCTLLSKSDCGSPHLFCQLPEERCLSKVRLGGSCDGFQDEICARGQCIKGVCTLPRTREGDYERERMVAGDKGGGGGGKKVDVGELARRLTEGQLPRTRNVKMSATELEGLCDAVQPILASQPMLLETSVPITIVGDIHGQYSDLLRLFDNNGQPGPSNRYLFLGDYVDRGKMGTETIALLFAYKVLFPNHMFLLRGNHESAAITRIYGFFDEMSKRYSTGMWKKFTDVFNWLPVAAVVEQRILCMHGGLSPHLTALQQIRDLERPSEVPDKGIMCDLLWSDPNKQVKNGWAENTRGIAFTFAPDVVKDFCKAQDLDLVVRAHQVVEAGYEFFAGRRLLTIFSAPNYCGEFENSAAIMKISADLECSFVIFRPETNKGQGAPAG